MNQSMKIYLLSLLLFGGGILLVLHYGNALYINTQFISTPISVGSFWDTLQTTFIKQLSHPLALLLVQIIVIMAAARTFGIFISKFSQPPVIGEIVAGVLLGPSLLGLVFPEFSALLFPKSSFQNLHFLSQIGLLLFMFVVGMELDFDKLKQQTKASVVISHISIIFPFFLGTILAYIIYPSFASTTVTFTAFALFIGIAMSITAFPVLARILKDHNLTKTSYGAMALTCAAADDATAWYILAIVIAVSTSTNLLMSILMLIPIVVYVTVMLFVVKPFLRKIGNKIDDTTLDMKITTIVLVVLLTSSLITELLGIHALFGAFMAGVMMPSSSESQLKERIAPRLEYVSLLVLLPLFFALTGLRTQINLLESQHWIVCLSIIAVAVIGKFIGSAIASRFMGISWKDSFAIGALMNTRGLMELVVLNIGYELGILSPILFTMFVIMALVTTFMTGPLLYLIDLGFKKH
ncbi:MAG: cation:proton antiporter [Sulfurospirillaceae bacterium]|nr:cation:proton antiporter [Sulfurospirillaceae bacterium]